MKYSICFLLLLTAISSIVETMDWPISNALITDNFGKNKAGMPILGVSFAVKGTLTASDSGDLLFAQKQSNKASRLPFPLGTWFAIDQGNSMIGIYSRLSEEDVYALAHHVEQGDKLLSTGLSGFSKQEGFHFSLYDRTERQWVNPVKFAPQLQDNLPPSIQEVRIYNSLETIVLTGRVRISQGQWTISVTASDFINDNENSLAPHSISLLLNGQELYRLDFESIIMKEGMLMVYKNGFVPARQIYAPVPGFELGSVQLNRGQTNLEIAVRDLQGNSRSSIFELLVE